MSDMSIDQVLQQMRTMSARIDSGLKPTESIPPAGDGEFAGLLRQSIDAVNGLQKTAGNMSQRLEAGDPGVTLEQVMLAREKASVAFTGVTQVRNKLVDAYKEIMSMPI